MKGEGLKSPEAVGQFFALFVVQTRKEETFLGKLKNRIQVRTESYPNVALQGDGAKNRWMIRQLRVPSLIELN